ncbi:SDR family oxidoreductase [Devosia sp.]|uniref:SDR family oxidoreductase n=1 Tax=Devosia sp. TaxID=1871048 RepID=UPI0035240610
MMAAARNPVQAAAPKPVTRQPGQPNEVATCHLFLACDESSYITGQVLHPNGGEIVGG